MPGLLGAVSIAAPLDAGFIGAMRGSLARQRRYSPVIESEYEDAHAFIAMTWHDGSSGVAAADGHAVAVFGEVAEPDLVARSKAKPGTPALPYALAERTRDNGVRALYDLEGTYAIVHWDASARVFSVLTDRTCGMNFYYWDRDDSVVFASHLELLVRLPAFDTRLSEAGVADLMAVGSCLSTRTLFASVRRAPYARCLTWETGSRGEYRYWQPYFAPDKPGRSLADYTAQLYEALADTVRTWRGHDIVLPLSAGFDSRILAGVAAKELDRTRLRAFTLGSRESYDGAYAPLIAKRIGIAHRRIDIPETFFADYSVEGARRIDGSAVGHTCWRMAADDFLRERPGELLVNGVCAEPFHGNKHAARINALATEDDALRYYYNATHYWRITGDDELAKLYRPEMYANVAGLALETLLQRYREAPAATRISKIDYVAWTEMWPRRYQRMNMDYNLALTRVAHPFRHKRFLDLMRTLPWEMRDNSAIFVNLLATYLPEAASVPLSRGGMPISGTAWTNAYYRSMGWLQFKAIPAATFGRVKWRNRGTYVHYAHWLQTSCRAYVEKTLSEGDYLSDYFDMDYLRAMCADVLEGRSNDYGKVYNLVSFVLFRKYFCDRRGNFGDD